MLLRKANKGLGTFPSIVAVLVGAVLLLSGLSKAHYPAETESSLRAAFPGMNARPFVAGLIVSEILLGAALVARLNVRLSLAVSTVLFAGFSAYLLWLRYREIDLGCGCGLSWLVRSLGWSDKALALPRAIGLFGLCLLAWSLTVWYREGSAFASSRITTLSE